MTHHPLTLLLRKAHLALTVLLGLSASGAVLGARRLASEGPPAAERPPPSRLAAEGVFRLPHRRDVTAVAFSPAGKILATGDIDGGLYLWDVAAGKELWRAEAASAFSVAFSPDERTLATGGGEGIVRVWDAASRTKLREFRANFREDVYTLAFSPDGKALAVGGRSHWVSVWDVDSGKVIRSLDGRGRIHSVAFSPDGKMLTCGTAGERMHVWDAVTGEEARRFRGKELRGNCVAFSPDGRILAAGGSDRGIAVVAFREIATGEVLCRLRTDTDRVHALSFSPDGRALAVAGSKPVVKVWGLATGQLLGEFEGHRDEVFSVRFSPGGKFLAAGSRDKTALIWDVPRRMKKEEVSSPALTAEGLERLWADLAGDDIPTAYRAVWTFSAAPEQAVPVLRERLRSATAFDERRVKQLIVDLDSDRFAVRQQAESELGKIGWVAESALRRARQGDLSLELRRRLTNLLREVESASPSADWLRVARAIAALERIGTPPARRILKTLTDGAPEARLTREAGGALRRLLKRSHE